jgi:NTE family protein
VSKVGLVLGGGGITGASYHFGALLAIEMATGWDPAHADVIVGTSSGAFTAAMLRGGQLTLDTLIGNAATRQEVSDRLRGYVYRRGRPRGVIRWLRKGVLPSMVRPDVGIVLGCPALYTTDGLVEWVEHALGDLADGWPSAPTVIVAYDLDGRKRVPFGTERAPEVPLKIAVAASAAVPFIFEPVRIDGRWYADGGIATGTSADLVLASQEPLDVVLVIAPLAALEPRPHARFYEDVFDRLGRTALDAELEKIRTAWPDTDIVVLRPDEHVLSAARPNPMSLDAAVPAFLRTLRSLRDHLGSAETWDVLSRHLVRDRVR